MVALSRLMHGQRAMLFCCPLMPLKRQSYLLPKRFERRQVLWVILAVASQCSRCHDPLGYFRSESSESSPSTSSPRHSSCSFGTIQDGPKNDRRATLLGTLWPCASTALLAKCSPEHDRVLWTKSCNRPNTFAISDPATGGTHVEYQNPNNGAPKQLIDILLCTDSDIEKDDEYKERSAVLLTSNSKKVLDLLSMYIQAAGMFFLRTRK